MQKLSAATTGFAIAALSGVATLGQAQAQKAPAVQKAQVAVTQKGYQPASLMLRAGVPARITFTRKTDATCATEVVFPDDKVTKPLPLNKPVVVAFTPKKKGTYAFTCGMKMFKGKVVVR